MGFLPGDFLRNLFECSSLEVSLGGFLGVLFGGFYGCYFDRFGHFGSPISGSFCNAFLVLFATFPILIVVFQKFHFWCCLLFFGAVYVSPQDTSSLSPLYLCHHNICVAILCVSLLYFTLHIKYLC